MDRYNDYYRLTEGYLRNYRDLQMTLAVLISDRADAVRSLENVKPPTSCWGVSTRGGETMSNPESQTEKANVIQADLWAINRDIESLEHLLHKVTMSLSVLSGAEKDIITLFYFEGKRWEEIEKNVKYSERQGRRLCRRAVWRVVNMLFHHRQDERMKFIFAT